MSEIQPSGFVVQDNQPLIGITMQSNGREVVQFFVDEDEADAAVPQDATQDAISLAGAWSDLDWEEMEEALDKIRHESKPTPPLSL